jgi:hypothetical protein
MRLELDLLDFFHFQLVHNILMELPSLKCGQPHTCTVVILTSTVHPPKTHFKYNHSKSSFKWDKLNSYCRILYPFSQAKRVIQYESEVNIHFTQYYCIKPTRKLTASHTATCIRVSTQPSGPSILSDKFEVFTLVWI